MQLDFTINRFIKKLVSEGRNIYKTYPIDSVGLSKALYKNYIKQENLRLQKNEERRSREAEQARRSELKDLARKNEITSDRRKYLTPRDEEVLARIRRSKSRANFDRIYNGEIKGEKADVQLMFALAFFTKSDRSQMERIYKSSALYDPSKTDGYIKKTISIAIYNLNKKTSPQKPSSKNRDKWK